MIGTRGKWTEREDKIIRDCWSLIEEGSMSLGDIGRRLDRTGGNVGKRARALGLVCKRFVKKADNKNKEVGDGEERQV
jgi:hypothetical protein